MCFKFQFGSSGLGIYSLFSEFLESLFGSFELFWTGLNTFGHLTISKLLIFLVCLDFSNFCLDLLDRISNLLDLFCIFGPLACYIFTTSMEFIFRLLESSVWTFWI